MFGGFFIDMQQEDKVFVTKEGLENLKREYKDLVEVKRPSIVERIKSAKEAGDISENADYEAAREAQAFTEGRIRELDDMLKRIEIISDSVANDIISLGSTVKVHVDGSDEEFYIVGAPEANPIESKISHESPLGKALLGKKVGDKVDVEAPVGKLTYTVLKIS